MQDLGITAIHRAVQFPTDPASVRSQQALAQADAVVVDRVLKRILNYLHGRNERWPARRLFRCLDYIVQHCNHQASNAIFHSRSFRLCVKAALNRLAQYGRGGGGSVTTATATATDGQQQHTATPNLDSMQTIIKFIGDVLEHRSCNDALLMEVRQSRAIMHILQLAGAYPTLESNCLRTLAAKGKFFAKDLIEYDAFYILASLVGRVPDLLIANATATTTATTTATSSSATSHAIRTLHLCVKVARTFENLMSYTKSPRADTQSREKALRFVQSINFVAVAKSWEISSSQYLENPSNSIVRKLMHSLTSIVSSCVSVSKDAALPFSDIRSAFIWRSALSHDMKTFLNLLRSQQQQQSNDEQSDSITMMDEVAIRMQRVARIALGVAVSNGKSGSYQQSSIDELTQDITTFLLLLGLDAITPEHITLIGRPATGAMDAWFEEWNFDHVSGVWTASLLKRYQDLFIVLLECYIQHLQLASKLMVIGVSGYFAHFLINTLVALKDDVVNEQLQQEQEEAQPNKSLSIAATTLSILSTQPIPARMQKLVSYFLHFDNAIQVFATAPIYLNDVIWVPTIRNAFHGLTLFAADDNDVDMDMVEVGPPLLVQLQQENQRNKQQENQDTILYKAKRAFSVLRAVTKFSNACAKLEQAGALHMVNIKYIPNSEVLETSVSVLNVYASFTHFIAALASTMALIRAKLRSDDAFPIGPAIMKLLWQATIRIHECQEKNLRNAWTHVVSGSLMVINAFEFDNESLQKWLAWPVHFTDCDGDNDSVITEVNSRGWIHSLRTNNGRLSVLPTILQALLPGRQSSDRYEILQDRISNSDYLGMLLHAVNAFNLLSTVPECGVQLVRDAEAMEFLCELLKGLLEQTKNSNYSPRLKAKSGEDIKMEVQTGADSGNEVNRISSILDSNNDNNSSSSSSDSERLTTSFTRSLSNRCYELLHRGLVRILASQENMRFIITSDVLTAFFKPLRTSIAEMDDYKLELSQTLCQDFYEERFEDFARLFQFTVGDDNATRLHELCAVATAYACPYPSHWDTVLGIRVVDGEEIIHNKSVFGALCRMLMFELLEQDSDNVYEAPYRRPAAAQAIEVLTQVLTPAWVADRQDIVVQLRDRISSSVEKEEDLDDSWRTNNDEHSEDMVAFTTEHSSIPITAKRGPLVRQSTFFAALFSGEYAENPDKTVKLLDITDHALTLFLDVINNIQLGEMRLSSSTCWRDVIDLLLAADRFGSTSVQSVCEEWISRSLVDQGNQGRLNGAILLFRRCRNPGAVDGGMALDVWPFQKVLKQALMIVVSELSVSCQATEFDNMLRDNDEDELSAFCQGMAVLICSTLDKM